jgi:hypothetical protein
MPFLAPDLKGPFAGLPRSFLGWWELGSPYRIPYEFYAPLEYMQTIYANPPPSLDKSVLYDRLQPYE